MPWLVFSSTRHLLFRIMVFLKRHLANKQNSLRGMVGERKHQPRRVTLWGTPARAKFLFQTDALPSLP